MSISTQSSTALCALALIACGDPPDPEDPGTDTGDCVVPADPELLFRDLGLRKTEQPTVWQVEWQGIDTDGAWVEVWDDEGTTIQAPAREGEKGGTFALLVGLEPDHEYDYRAVTELGGTRFCSPPGAFSTEPWGPELPSFTLESVRPEEAAGGFTVMAVSSLTGSSMPQVLVLNAGGAVVWATEAAAIRARLSLDREAVLFNDMTWDPGTVGTLTRYPLGGGEVEVMSVPDAHLDFVEVEPGLYAAFGWDLRFYESCGRTLAGETIIEFSSEQEPRWSGRSSTPSSPTSAGSTRPIPTGRSTRRTGATSTTSTTSPTRMPTTSPPAT